MELDEAEVLHIFGEPLEHFGRSFISLMTVWAWFRRASRAFMADSYLNFP
jgi:hypothetical protein